ncbi:unnamed protein product, partial [marine sediment metagenome]
MKSKIKNFVEEGRRKLPLEDGTVYSRRRGIQPFSVSPLQDYIP